MRCMLLFFLILRITVQSKVTYNSLKEANYSSPRLYSKEEQNLQGCIICLCNGHEGCCHVGLD
ncbi:hypothetical protein BJV82DRAFT_629905 [Fennellomyces sp. T-0311]|nr:hypothetical protein BJV82DRAFT_629905 [Fennellomyces sp. T-0311]